MPEYDLDEAFEHRLERTLREIGDEAVRPFDPYETTQLVVSSTRIAGVPIPPPAPPPRAESPPRASAPRYVDYPETTDSRRWPLLAALALLIASVVFAGFATGFIKLPSNFGITIGTPGPASNAPIVTGSPAASESPARTRRPARSPRRHRSPVPQTAQPQTLAPATVEASPTSAPAPPSAVPSEPPAPPSTDAPPVTAPTSAPSDVPPNAAT